MGEIILKTRIVIYGYSGGAKDIIYSLDTEEYETVGIIDDAIDAHGYSNWAGVEVKTVDYVCNWIFDYVIISAPWYYDQMFSNLVSHGVDENKIIVWKHTEKISCLDQRIAYLRLCSDLVKERNISGACAEVGVYKGDFAKYINRFLPDRKLYLFDTFEGFGKQNLLEIETKGKKGALDWFQDTSVQHVLKKMKAPDKCVVCKGYFPQTAQGIEDEFALVSLDADLYEPILNGLAYFYPRITRGGVYFCA